MENSAKTFSAAKTAEYTENERSLPSREELLSFLRLPDRRVVPIAETSTTTAKKEKSVGLFYDDFSVKKPTVKAIERDFTIKIAARNGPDSP